MDRWIYINRGGYIYAMDYMRPGEFELIHHVTYECTDEWVDHYFMMSEFNRALQRIVGKNV